MNYLSKPSTAQNPNAKKNGSNTFVNTDYYRQNFEDSKYGISGNRICYKVPNTAVSGKLSSDPYMHKMENAFVRLATNITDQNFAEKYVTENDEPTFQFSVKN